MKQFNKIMMNVNMPANERSGIQNLLVEVWIDGQYACSLDNLAENAYEHPIGLVQDGGVWAFETVPGVKMLFSSAAYEDVPRCVLGYGNRIALKLRWYKVNLYASVDAPKLKSISIQYTPIDAPILRTHELREGTF